MAEKTRRTGGKPPDEELTIQELEDEAAEAEAEITRLMDRKREIRREVHARLTVERAGSLLEGMTAEERDAIARVAALQLGGKAVNGGN